MQPPSTERERIELLQRMPRASLPTNAAQRRQRAGRIIAWAVAGICAVLLCLILFVSYHPLLLQQSTRPAAVMSRPTTRDYNIEDDVIFAAAKPASAMKDVNVRPHIRQPSPDTASQTRYLAYFTHSGYHNQRIALENALTLAKLMGRTLLAPPIRLGNAIPYVSFDKLHFRLNQASKAGLEHCKTFDEYGILPRECIDYFDWTSVGWDLMMDMEGMIKRMDQPVIDRWNGTLEWLEEELGIKEDEDIYAFKDDSMYQFRYYDSPDDTEPLEKFERRIELSDLRQLDEYRLLHVGSLFGTSRLRTTGEDAWEVRSAFRQAMVFRNPLLDKITDTIRDRLGGPENYYAVHMRVGDGVFLKDARQNCAKVFTDLLTLKMKLPLQVADELVALHGSQALPEEDHRGRTHVWTKRDTVVEEQAAENSTLLSNGSRLKKRASNSRPQRPGAYKHAWPKPIAKITSRSASPLHSSLSCRGPLYKDADSPLIHLNAPLFLATDSRIPTADPNLALFFKAFPCTFVLSDFGSASELNNLPVTELHDLERWRNEDDHVPLAPFFVPVVDMMIAAKARMVVGTPKSTFSRFAIDVLYQAYHGWPMCVRLSLLWCCAYRLVCFQYRARLLVLLSSGKSSCY